MWIFTVNIVSPNLSNLYITSYENEIHKSDLTEPREPLWIRPRLRAWKRLTGNILGKYGMYKTRNPCNNKGGDYLVAHHNFAGNIRLHT